MLMFITMGTFGVWQIVLILLLIVLLFGARKIPELMRGAGRGVKEFKDAMNKDYTAEDEKKPTDNADTNAGTKPDRYSSAETTDDEANAAG